VRAAEFMPLVGVGRDVPCMQDYEWRSYLWRSRRHWGLLAAVVWAFGRETLEDGNPRLESATEK